MELSHTYVFCRSPLKQFLGKGILDCSCIDPVYTVPEPLGLDIKLNGFKTCVTRKRVFTWIELIPFLFNHRGLNDICFQIELQLIPESISHCESNTRPGMKCSHESCVEISGRIKTPNVIRVFTK